MMTIAHSQSEILIGEILHNTSFSQESNEYEIAKLGVETLLAKVFEYDLEHLPRVDKDFVDLLINQVDQVISEQLDLILHHPEFQNMESAWRSLRFLCERTDFNENIIIHYLNITKQEIIDDIEDCGSEIDSALYRKIYTENFGQYGGAPYGVIIADYEVAPRSNDISFLQSMASICAMTHSPMIAGTSPSFFGIDDYEELPSIKGISDIFDGPQFIEWRELREKEDSRNIGLVLPRFMLRREYGNGFSIKSFNYCETIKSKSDYLWGNAAFTYATRLTESFAKYRWCPNIIGPQSGGAISDLPFSLQINDGKVEISGPAETIISDRREYELSELGFVPLVMRKDSNSAVFFSSNSIQKAKRFGNDADGKQAETNYRLGTQLPYLFIVNRLAHYIKVLQRENLGSWKSRSEVEAELNKWIKQYIADQDNPTAATRSQRPLRRAKVSVGEVVGDAGWYKVSLEVTPHFKFMGANFTLSLTSMIEKN